MLIKAKLQLGFVVFEIPKFQLQTIQKVNLFKLIQKNIKEKIKASDKVCKSDN